MGFFKDLDIEVPAQVIEAPKISQDIIPQGSVDLVPQRAEQLVEVPTVLSPTRIALRIAEQIVDTPVPQGRGQGFLPEQSSSATSSSGKRISEQTVEQHVDIPVPGGGGPSSGLLVFPLDRVQQRRLPRNAFLSGLWSISLTLFQVEVFLVLMSLVKGFFALFPKIKKCEVGLALGVGTAPRVEPIHAGCSAGGLCRVGALLELTY